MATKPKQPPASAPLYGRVREILETARAGVVRTVNTTQVVANWLIGREIVEEEQQGRHRAEYGLQLVTQLSEQLTTAYGRGVVCAKSVLHEAVLSKERLNKSQIFRAC